MALVSTSAIGLNWEVREECNVRSRIRMGTGNEGSLIRGGPDPDHNTMI